MTSLLTSPPPPDAEELRVWTLDTAHQLQRLRAELLQAVIGHAPTDDEQLADTPESMVVVATELATNALRHGRPPTVVRLLRTEDQFVLDVADHDLTNFPEHADIRPTNTGGRGLHLAQSFSLHVGWYATEHTKHVWATFPIPG